MPPVRRGEMNSKIIGSNPQPADVAESSTQVVLLYVPTSVRSSLRNAPDQLFRETKVWL